MKKRLSRKKKLQALEKESDRDLTEMVRRQLALSFEKRMNFLRIRLPRGGSTL